MIRPFDAADLDAAWTIRRLAFGGPRTPDPDWLDGGWYGWLASVDGRPSGFARVWPYRQFFGGAAVPMGGVASVAVSPHARGRGVAGALLGAALPAMRERGHVISALYPSVVGLYRKFGWEQTGVAESVTLPPVWLRSMPASVPLRAGERSDLAALHACYLALASTVDGLLDRSTPPFDLAEVLTLDVVTVAPGPDGLRGYLTATRTDAGLVVHDLVALDADTWRTLLRTVGSWAGQAGSVTIRLLDSRLLTPSGLGPTLHSEPWMLRVVDLPGAVAARGWPRAAQLRPCVVDVELADPHAPWHHGRHRLVVEDGRVTLEPGGTGAVRVTARGLAAWYAGAADTAALRRAGLLTGPEAPVLDALTASAHTPRLADSF